MALGKRSMRVTDDVASDETSDPVGVLLKHIWMVAIVNGKSGRVGARRVERLGRGLARELGDNLEVERLEGRRGKLAKGSTGWIDCGRVSLMMYRVCNGGKGEADDAGG